MLSPQDVQEAISIIRDLPDAWSTLLPTIDSGRFFLLSRVSSVTERGQNLVAYRFAHPTLQRFLAAHELHRGWNEGANSPVSSVEELVCDDCWHDLLPHFAEHLKQPVALVFQEVSDKQLGAVARLIETGVVTITSLEFKGSGLGQKLAAFRSFAATIGSDTAGRLGMAWRLRARTCSSRP